jgi:hypothetical protein
MRGRDLYIHLFSQSATLVNLGYSGSQITRATNVLSLLTEPGEIENHLKNNPYLLISQDDGARGLDLEIYRLPKLHGFYLDAFQNDMRGMELVEAIFRTESRNQIFAHSPALVAYVALFHPTVDLTNLHELVPDLAAGLTSTEALLGVRPETPLTKPLQILGLTGTYQAAWVDNRTKHEFVAKIEVPEVQDLEPYWVAFRKLTPISDAQGSMTPFGLKPNVDQNKVMKILEEQKEKAFSGVFAPEHMVQR